MQMESLSHQVRGLLLIGANDWPLTIGYDDRSGAPQAYFTGDIAWVGIWQTALNEVDIRNIHLALKGRM